MNRARRLAAYLGIIAMTCFAFACVPDQPRGNGSGSGSGGGSAISSLNSMEKFESEAEFEAFMEAWAEENESGGQYGTDDATGAQNDAEAAPASDADDGGDADVDNEDITNTQEEDVDEGGIVKNVGDYLVVLRRGGLFAVDISEDGEQVQTDGIRVAPKEELTGGVWYDEMLVRGNMIYVIGYRYGANVVSDDEESSIPHWIFGATEVSTFALGDDGTLTRGESEFFESNDYFSGTNYASRLVDDELIFYMPYYAFIEDPDNPMPVFPQFLEHKEDNQFTPAGPIFGPTDIIQPIESPNRITFHTVIQCELPEDLTIDCSARSLMAEPSREFYVSGDHVYLWNHDHVFALAQQDDLAAAHTVDGRPANQFSFAEVDDVLHVEVSRAMDPEEAGMDEDTPSWELPRIREMLSLPLSDFNAEGKQSLENKRALITDDSEGFWWVENRHIDGWYLVGDGETLYAHHIASETTQEFDLEDENITRIEMAAGLGGLVVSSSWEDDERKMRLRTVLLDGEAELVDAAEYEGVGEGEHRSHAFFFRPDEDGGLFGLPVVGDGYGTGWWGFGASNIAFFRADASGDIELRGAVSSTEDADGECISSCADWYGNTRPIFIGDRVFALMGSEFVQVDIDKDVEEVGERVVLSTGSDEES